MTISAISLWFSTKSCVATKKSLSVVNPSPVISNRPLENSSVDAVNGSHTTIASTFPFSKATRASPGGRSAGAIRSEEHTSELQSRFELVCRLLLEKNNKKHNDVV